MNFLTCILDLFGSAMGPSLLHRRYNAKQLSVYTSIPSPNHEMIHIELIKDVIPHGILKFILHLKSTERPKLMY